MKVIVFSFFIFSKTIFGEEVGEKFPPEVKDSKQFLFYTDRTVVLPNFNYKGLNYREEKTVIKIPAKEIEKYGLRAGSIIQSIDVETGIKNPNFKLKDFVYAFLIDVGYSRNSKKNLRVILSYDEKIIDEIKKIEEFADYPTGIAYSGLERELFPAKEGLLPVTQINQVDFKRDGWNPKEKDTKLYSVKIFENTLYIRKSKEEMAGYEPILKTPSGHFGLIPNGRILTFDHNSIRINSWGKDEKLLILTGTGEVACSYLYFIKKNDLSYVPLPCVLKQ